MRMNIGQFVIPHGFVKVQRNLAQREGDPILAMREAQ